MQIKTDIEIYQAVFPINH